MDRKRLLLDGFHVSLQEIVVQSSVSLSIALQFAQRNLGLAGDLRLRYRAVELLSHALFVLLGDLEIALVGFGNALQLVAN